MSYVIQRCAHCDDPIEFEDFEKGDDPDLCSICNLIHQENM